MNSRDSAQITRALNAISAHLEAINKFLESWRKKEDARTQHEQPEQREPEPLPVQARIEIPESVEDYFKADADKEKWHKKNLMVNAGTLVALAITLPFVVLQWCSMEETLNEVAKQSQDMNAQTIIARRSMENSQRPWVTADMALSGNGFSYRDDGGGFLSLIVTFNNFGASATPTIVFLPELYISHITRPDVTIRRDELCNRIARRQLPNDGALFPGRPSIMAWNVDLPKAHIDQYVPANSTINPSRFMPIALIACVAYRSTVSEAKYYTGYLFSVVTADGLMPTVANIAQTQLALIPNAMGPVVLGAVEPEAEADRSEEAAEQ